METKTDKLTFYGATKIRREQASQFSGLVLARIISQYKDLYRIVTSESEGLAEVSGKFRHAAQHATDFPAVGDFVLVDRPNTKDGNAIIHSMLPRTSSFERSAAGETGQVQIIAANVDIVFICTSLNDDFNLNRLERYISLAWSSGATPVIVLTKADLCDDLDDIMAQISGIAFGIDIVTTSSYNENPSEKLLSYLGEGVTAAFIGSSGVGKSTLINHLLGKELQETSAIREDDSKGRHTTTRRDLIAIVRKNTTGEETSYGVVIDTPGMRELGVEPTNLSQSFSDIADLAYQCRFNDCSHTNEPGCAVQQALQEGTLDMRRFENYLKLQKESRYEGMSSRQIEEDKITSMVGSFNEMKQIRTFVKQKNKRRD